MNYYIDVLKKYTVFTGRAARKEYWMFALWNFIIVLALTVVSSIIVAATKNSAVGFVVDLLWLGSFPAKPRGVHKETARYRP